MFLCRHNQVHTSFCCHYDVIICGGSSWLCDFSPRKLVFTPREVKMLQNQERPLTDVQLHELNQNKSWKAAFWRGHKLSVSWVYSSSTNLMVLSVIYHFTVENHSIDKSSSFYPPPLALYLFAQWVLSGLEQAAPYKPQCFLSVNWLILKFLSKASHENYSFDNWRTFFFFFYKTVCSCFPHILNRELGSEIVQILSKVILGFTIFDKTK